MNQGFSLFEKVGWRLVFTKELNLVLKMVIVLLRFIDKMELNDVKIVRKMVRIYGKGAFLESLT